MNRTKQEAQTTTTKTAERIQFENNPKTIARVNVRQTIGYAFLPQQYSKQELYDKQIKLNALISYALVTRDADLMEASYELALEYRWQEGYAQEPTKYGLEQAQNTDPSIVEVIKQLRKEAQNPTTGNTTHKQAEQLLFEVARRN